VQVSCRVCDYISGVVKLRRSEQTDQMKIDMVSPASNASFPRWLFPRSRVADAIAALPHKW
jgi:hypothetical protein